MNVTRLCEIAAGMVACRHDNTVPIPAGISGRIGPVSWVCRWCSVCGALRAVGQTTWLLPEAVAHAARQLVDDPPSHHDEDKIPLPLAMRRRRRP